MTRLYRLKMRYGVCINNCIDYYVLMIEMTFRNHRVFPLKLATTINFGVFISNKITKSYF